MATTALTFDEMTDHLAAVVQDTQIETLLQRFVNLTLGEIWTAAPWGFKRRKQTFATVASQEDYNLDAEVDEIRLLRLRSTPRKLVYIPDHIFYELQADPEGTGSGTPWGYRLWEETGFATNLAAADTVYINSSSTADTSTFTVRISGRNSSGEIVTETLTLNGTSNVTSSTTWAASGLMQISKSARTTGTITCYRTTGATQLTELAPDETAPRFKRLSLYPIPSSALTLYLEYDERLRPLFHATDVPQMDHKWNWVLIEGALAKTWEYKQNETASAQHYAIYRDGLKQMMKQDARNMDYVPALRPRQYAGSIVKKFSDSVSNNFPYYGVGY